MLLPLAFGTGVMVLNLGVQILAVVFLVRYFTRRIGTGAFKPTLLNEAWVLSVVMAVLLIGHILQIATWALLFGWLGEFEDFATAFYHSTVNFTSLGYGDIVMSESRRLLGALEAANGVLMFGLSAGLILSVMHRLFSRRMPVDELREKMERGA